MKKVFLFSTIFLVLLGLAGAAVTSSEQSENNIFVHSIRTPEIKDSSKPIVVGVQFESIGKDLDNSRIQVWIPELNVFVRKGPFDVKGKEISKNKILLKLPDDTEVGEYLMRITIGKDKNKRVVHRFLRVN